MTSVILYMGEVVQGYADLSDVCFLNNLGLHPIAQHQKAKDTVLLKQYQVVTIVNGDCEHKWPQRSFTEVGWTCLTSQWLFCERLFKILICVISFWSHASLSSIIVLTFEVKNVTIDYTMASVVKLTVWPRASNSVYHNIEQGCLKMVWKRCKLPCSICRLRNLYRSTKFKVLLNWMVSKHDAVYVLSFYC